MKVEIEKAEEYPAFSFIFCKTLDYYYILVYNNKCKEEHREKEDLKIVKSFERFLRFDDFIVKN